MSKAGQYNQKGILAQNQAALSLFLQFLKIPGFSYIRLEPDDSEDFDLVFADGRKVICESKFRREIFAYSQLLELLTIVRERKVIGDQDEILVVCKNASRDMIYEIKNIRWFKELGKKFEKNGFDAESVALLPRVKFWVLSKGLNRDINHSLIADLLGIWLPPGDIQRFTDSIMHRGINESSTWGGSYSRADFERDIAELKAEVQLRSDYFNDKKSKEDQFLILEKDISDSKGIEWGSGSLTAFSLRWDLMSFATDRLKSRNDLDLEKWKDLWQLDRAYYFAFNIFHIFENNLHSEQNKAYALSYTKKYVKSIRGFYSSDFLDTSVISLVTKIIKSLGGTVYVNDAFEIMKDMVSVNKEELFYLKDDPDDHRQWEKGEICKVFQQIYEMADSDLKQKIFRLIITTFNITEDSGQFSFYTPKEAYELIEKWLSEDFIARFLQIVILIANQYDRSYKKISKKIEFKGWEHMGGITSFWGDDYDIADYHHVSYIIAPAIKKFYDSDPEKGWRFIKLKCISRTSEVRRERPDFLNRSACNIVLERYASENKAESKEAFSILKEFMTSRRGIPHKSELIFRAVKGLDLPADKKWKLVEIAVKISNKYKSHVNPFVEQIVARLAKEGYQKAKELLRSWLTDPEYARRQSFFGANPATSIRAQLDSDADFAADLFKMLLESNLLESNDEFHAYDVARLLHDILKRDYEKGLSIVRWLESLGSLNQRQQVIYTHGFFDGHGNDESDDSALLLRLYNDVVNPFLNMFSNDIDQICARLPSSNCREALVQFAGRLTVKKKIPEAMRIIQVFINDPDPYLPGNDPSDPEGKYNEHRKIEQGNKPGTITSVRGWCGWVLMKCAVLDGRVQIPQVIRLCEKLLQDENFYVVHMGCFALSQLARNRLTVLPDDKECLFLDDDLEKALKMAKDIEGLAFGVLERLIAWPPSVQKAMAKSVLLTFDSIRALSEKDALKLISFLAKQSKDVIGEAAHLFIYYAEFRKDNYQNWKFSRPGLYDDLGADQYDAEKFRKILLDSIERLQKEDVKACFRFAASFEHIIRDVSGSAAKGKVLIDMVLPYFHLLTNVYDHDIFRLIYKTIETKITNDNEDFKIWYDLFFKCLGVEKRFYDDNFVVGKTTEMYWWPSSSTSTILEAAFRRSGKDKFLQMAGQFFAFPKELRLGETENLVAILESLAPAEESARRILKQLFDRNPSKYWDRRGLFQDT